MCPGGEGTRPGISPLSGHILSVGFQDRAVWAECPYIVLSELVPVFFAYTVDLGTM